MLGTFFRSCSFSFTWMHTILLSHFLSLILLLTVSLSRGWGVVRRILWASLFCLLHWARKSGPASNEPIIFGFCLFVVGAPYKTMLSSMMCFFFVFIPVFTEGMFHYVPLPHQTQWTLTPTFSAAYHYLGHTAKHPCPKIVFPFPWPSVERCYFISHTNWQKKRGIKGDIRCQGDRQLYGKHW